MREKEREGESLDIASLRELNPKNKESTRHEGQVTWVWTLLSRSVPPEQRAVQNRLQLPTRMYGAKSKD